MINQYYKFLCVLVAFFITRYSYAALTVNITGFVVEGMCEINNDETINVDFGSNLQPRLINGENYMTNIDFSLKCEDLDSDTLVMQLEGTPALFSEHYLNTDKEGLGIKMYMNGEVMPLNTWMPFTWRPDQKPILQAAPVKSDVAEVEVGVFFASGTLKIQYQ